MEKTPNFEKNSGKNDLSGWDIGKMEKASEKKWDIGIEKAEKVKELGIGKFKKNKKKFGDTKDSEIESGYIHKIPDLTLDEVNDLVKPVEATEKEKISISLEEKNLLKNKEAVEIKEDIELTKYQQAKIEQKFSEFNIDKKDINGIEDFNHLSYGQRLLVLDNLKQLTLGRIREEALIKNKAEITGVGFLEKVWKGISKKYQIAKIEKESVQEIEKGGIKAHGEILKQLVKGTDRNLEVVENKDGELEIKYASGFKNLKLEDQQKVDAFNEIATAFSKIPYEWSLETASKDQQSQSNKIKEEYERAKGNILIIKEQKSNKEGAFLYMSGIDGKLRLNQFLNTHPEVEKELENIKSPFIWARVLNDIITERGLLFGAGFAVRTATMSLVGTIGLPISAAVMGGYMGRKRAKESLKERELMARKGTKDVSQETKNIVTAESLSEKINLLINKIQSDQDEKNKAELLKSLEVRLYYTQEKLDSGLVNFGSADKRFLNQYNLIDRLNLGFSYTPPREDFELSGSDEIKLRLESFLALKERNISEAQKKYLWNQTRNGAIMGAAFATAGYAVKHFIQEFHFWDKIWGIGGVKSSNVSSVIEHPKSVGIGKVIVSEQPTLPSDSHIETSATSEILETKKLEDLSNLAIIQKGEGIEHALIRQLTDEPKKFGFQGDINNKAEIKIWADGESHRIAIKNEYVNQETGQETWIRESKGKPTFVILQDDKTIKFENADLYKTSGAELKETSEYEKHFENNDDIVNKKIEEIREKLLQEKIEGDQEMIEERTREMIKQENLKRGIENINQELINKDEAILEKENREITEKQIDEIIEKNKSISVDKMFLSSEKQEILDKLIDKNNAITISDVEDIAERIKKGNIAIEDFERYYASINTDAEKLSPKLLDNLKKNFEIINKGEKESVLAKKTIQTLLEKIKR